MNKLAVVSLLMVACVLMSEAMPRGGTSRAGAHTDPNHDDQHHEESGTSLSEQEKLSESLTTHERGLDELRALLQGESSRQNRLDRNNAQKNQRNTGRLYNFGDRVQSESLLNFQTIDNQAEFSNLDAKADVSSANKFALSLVSEDRFDESASIKKNDGRHSQTGTKLQTHDVVDAETLFSENEFDQSDFLDTSSLSAAGAARDALNAEEASKREQEAKLDAEKHHETNNAFQEGFVAGNFGSGHGRNTGGQTGGLFGGVSGSGSSIFGHGNSNSLGDGGLDFGGFGTNTGFGTNLGGGLQNLNY